jgi:hypothetical protein
MNGHRFLALVVALGVAVLSGTLTAAPALADDTTVPPDVTTWFDKLAGQNTASFINMFPAGYEVGPPMPDFQIGAAFLTADDPSAADLTPIEQWTAPISCAGEPAGTITAWRPDGDPADDNPADDNPVRFAVASADWRTAALMLTATSTSRFVDAGWMMPTLVDGTTVRQLRWLVAASGPHPLTDADVLTTDTATLRDAVQQRQADMNKPGMPPTGGVLDLEAYLASPGPRVNPVLNWITGVALVTLVAAVLVGSAIWTWRRHRRA